MPRTNRLVDRICQIYSDDESIWNIPINQFRAALTGLLGGYIAEQTIVVYFGLSAGEEADWDSLVALIIAKSNTSNVNLRDRAVEWINSVLNLYEDGTITAFDTPDKVWAWLMQV